MEEIALDNKAMKIAVVDIGGTCIKSGLWQNHEIGQLQETDTEASRGGDYVIHKVLRILESYQPFQAVGISTAGQVDVENGRILYANGNLPGFTGMPVREIIESAFHVPVALDNDVNCAAAGEAFYGAGREHENFLCLTYGTGVGGAIVLHREVHTGASYSAAEFGGILVHPEDREPSKDMLSGFYERYASTTALVQSVRCHFPEIHNGREIFARLEDIQIRNLVDAWIHEIVLGLVSLVHIFNPSLIVLGGGIMEQTYVIDKVRKQLLEQLIPSFRNVEVAPAALGNVAGMLGAAKAAQKAYLARKDNI